MVKCNKCEFFFSMELARCPRCGQKQKNEHFLRYVILAVALVCVANAYALYTFLTQKETLLPAVPAYARLPVAISPETSLIIAHIKQAGSDYVEKCTKLGTLIQLVGANEHMTAAVLFQSGLLPFGSSAQPHTHARAENFPVMRQGTVKVGMTECEVLATKGFPSSIKMNASSGGNIEQWVYPPPQASYVDFENSVVTKVQG